MKNFVYIILVSLVSLNGVSAQAKNDTVNQVDAKGLKQGHWIKKYPNGKVDYDGYFKDDRPAKLMRRYYDNGDIKSTFIYYDNDKACAAHIFYRDSIIMAQGLYREEKKDSTWTYYGSTGLLAADENYKMGIRHGTSTVYNPAGKVYEQFTYHEGEKNGPWRQYFEEGNLKVEGQYAKEKLEGWTKFYNVDGGVSHEGLYRNNVKDSIWNHYDVKGKIEIQQKYKMGRLKNADEVSDYIEKKKAEK